jgi:hypothetical protein
MRLEKVKFGPALGRVERAINKIVGAVNENRLASAPGYRIHGTGNGTALDIQVPKAKAATAGGDTRMRIVTVEGDYLTCRKQAADGTVVATDAVTLVAKPTFLRVTGTHGITRDGWSQVVVAPAASRTLTAVTAAGITVGLKVIEEVRPSYSINDTIYAMQPTGETSVVDPANANARLTWLDSNRDARAWLHRRIMLDACVLVGNTPTQKTIVFSAGPIP